MKKCFIKILIKLFVTVSVFECIYLFVVPPILQKAVSKEFIFSVIEKNTNIKVKADKIKIKTNIKPVITIFAENLSAENKMYSEPVLTLDRADVQLKLAPLLFKKIESEHFYIDKLNIYLLKNSDGSFNFENLFLNKGNKPLKLEFKNTDLRIDGSINTENAKSDFDMDVKFSYPFNYENFSKNNINGTAYIYNLDLNELSPVLSKILPKIEKTSGLVEYLQISAEKQDKKTSQIVLNTKYKDVLYNQTNWVNYIYAKGENKVNATVNIFDKTVHINRFKYEADKVDISANGDIFIKNKPKLDLNVSVKNSRTENIASILPPNLVKETMIIEKVKKYGIYGDMEGEAKIQGEVPAPNIVGYAKGRNIRILDKETRQKHNGTIDLTFDNHKLHMNILVDMPKKQYAKITGTTYMYRDGINNVTIKTTNNLDFQLAQTLAVPISKVFSFQLGPIPDMIITSGKGVLDLHVKGSLDFINIDGYCAFDNADLTYNTLYGKLTNAKGRLDFKDDNIIFKSERAFIQNNPISVDGNVQINNKLNFNVNSNDINADDLFEIVQKSELLKDVKNGLALFNSVDGKTKLSLNITANIVPVPFGQPPLPPEQAFTDLKVNGKLSLDDVQASLTGFKTPINDINGDVNFTETNVDFKNIYAKTGISSLKINGNTITDVKTKIPFVDVEITGDNIKIGDTIRFLAESYIYPKNYPDVSSLYNLDAKHELYFKYKAKSKEFLTNKAYALINIKKQTDGNPIQVQFGKVILDNANVIIDNVNSNIFNSNINISGKVKNVNTSNPVYNVVISSDRFNLDNLNRFNEVNILPVKMYNILKNFTEYRGFADFKTSFQNNILDTTVKFSGLSFKTIDTLVPIKVDDFVLKIFNDKLETGDITADIGDNPVYTKIKAEKIYTNPIFDGYITIKLSDNLIKNYFPKNISDKVSVTGEINSSFYIKGRTDDLDIHSNVVLFPNADAEISGVKIGDISDKREFSSDLYITPDFVKIKNLNYYKYITTQNNNIYPVLFAHGNGKLKYNSELMKYEAEAAYIKTEKNLSAKLLNAFLDKPLFKQGTVNCDIDYEKDKIKGEFSARNIDIPLFDTVVKDISLQANSDDINVKMFGFINDTAIRASSILKNDLQNNPFIEKINVQADNVDIDKLLNSISNARKEFNIKKEKGNSKDLSVFRIDNGELHIDSLTVNNYKAENFSGNFSVDKNGILNLNNINVDLGEGSAEGNILYDLKNTDMTAELDFRNIDSNSLAENLLDAKNQIYGIANVNFLLNTKGNTNSELLNNLSGFAYFDMKDGRMPKLGSLEYLLRASNIIKGGVTGFTINNILEILNLVKTGYFTSITGNCKLEHGNAKNIEIYSQGENLSLYLHGDYNISTSNADMEVLGKLSNRISTVFGSIGNTSINSFFKLIPGISLFDDRKNIIENAEKIPSFTGGNYDSRTFQAIIKGDINSSGYVQSFKWVK